MEGLQEQLSGALDQVMEDFKAKFREFQQQESLWNVIMAFVHAVNWKEPWICGVLCFEVSLFLLAILTRKNSTKQSVIFVVGMSFVYFGERLNKLGNKHWEAFSEQNYFDPRGVFYSTVISGPMLLILFLVLINYLRTCTSMLIQAKRMELKHKAREKHRAAKAQQQGGGAAASEPKKQK